MKLQTLPLLLFALFALLAFNFLLPNVYAQLSIGGFPSTTNFRPWVEFIVGNNQFPDSWLVFPNIVYYLILPFIAIVAVVYGIISDLRIFRYTRWVRGVIAVAMAGMTLPSGWLISAVLAFYAFNAEFAALAFGVVFFIGVILWAVGTTGRMAFGTVNEITQTKAQGSEINALTAQIRELRNQNINDINSNDQAAPDRIRRRDQRIRELQARIDEISHT